MWAVQVRLRLADSIIGEGAGGIGYAVRLRQLRFSIYAFA